MSLARVSIRPYNRRSKEGARADSRTSFRSQSRRHRYSHSTQIATLPPPGTLCDSVSKLRKRSGVFSNSPTILMPRANGWRRNHHQHPMQTMDFRKCIGQRLAEDDRPDRESSAKTHFIKGEPEPSESLASNVDSSLLKLLYKRSKSWV